MNKTRVVMIPKIIFSLVSIYLVYCLLAYFLQRFILFPRHLVEKPPEAPAAVPGITKFHLSLPFGKTEVWFMAPLEKERSEPPKPSPALLFAHGNAELIDDWPAFFIPLTQTGVAVLLVEYPGYGRSEGSPSQESIHQTLEAAHQWLASQPQVDPNRIILMGRSLGGAAVCTLAVSQAGCAMVLMSSFSSIGAFMKNYLLPGWVIRDPFDNLAAVAVYTKPVLVIHGNHDEVVPYSHGQQLHHAALKSEMLTYACGHNDCPPDQERFWQDVNSFLQKNGILNEL